MLDIKENKIDKKQYSISFSFGNTVFEVYFAEFCYSIKEKINGSYYTHNHYYNEVIYPIEGDLDIISKNGKNGIKEGQIVYIPKLYKHTTDYNTCKKYYSFGFIYKKLSINKHTEDTYKIFSTLFSNEILISYAQKKVSDISKEILTLLTEAKTPFLYYLLKAKAEEFLIYLFNNFYRNIKDDKITLDSVGNFDFLLSQKINQSSLGYYAKLKDIADSLFISERQLERKINSLYGESYTKRKNTLKIENAKNLLETTNLSVSEIAEKTQFYDSSSFIKVFKKQVGLTPLQFRKQNNKK